MNLLLSDLSMIVLLSDLSMIVFLSDLSMIVFLSRFQFFRLFVAVFNYNKFSMKNKRERCFFEKHL